VTAASREQFAALVRSEPVDLARAALLIGVETEPDLDLSAAEAALHELAAAVPAGVAGEPASVSAARLREALHTFEGSRDDYADLRSSLLHEVLRRHRGLPILLCLLWVEVGRRSGIAVYPIGTPGHFLAGVGDPYGDHVLVDPYRGGTEVSWFEIERLVVEASGIAVLPRHLDPAGPLDVLMRLLTNIRVLMAGEKPTLDHLMTRLWAVELSLLLPRHPVDLRRERAELLVRVGRFIDAAAEFERFAEAVEVANPEGASSARMAARVSRARCN
jgi:regulator of sirC expression with transglutaminase-like and TPR domain